jgi:ribonuclease J
MHERDMLAQDGFVAAVVRYDRKAGQLVGQPRIITRGFVFTPEAEELLSQARDVIRSAVSVKPGTAMGDVEKQVDNALSHFLYRETKRNPVVTSAAIEI